MCHYQKKNKDRKGQVTLEFTFCFIIVLLIFYSVVKAMQWVGISLVSPTYQYEQGVKDYQDQVRGSQDARGYFQLRNIDDRLPRMNLVYNGELMH